MPDYLFSYESVGVRNKNVLTRKAKFVLTNKYANLVEGDFMKKAIYKITNNINGKSYIGQTKNPDKRWRSHKSAMNQKERRKSNKMYDDMISYGLDAFSFSVIGWFDDYDDKERYYIKHYNTLVPDGYNILHGGRETPHKYGEDHHNSAYKNGLVDNIINDLLSKKYTQKEIETKYGVSQQLITSINRGVTHRREGVEYPIIKTSKYHVCDEDVEKIVYLLKNSMCTCAEIGKYFGVDTSTIKAINSGRNHYDESINYPIRNFRGAKNSQSVETILANRSTSAIDTQMEM